MEVFRLMYSNPKENRVVDIIAEDQEQAYKIAQERPEELSKRYESVWITPVPKGPSVIGIEFEYYDTSLKSFGSSCISVFAESDKSARAYYEAHLRGKNFWFNPGSTDATGKNIRGKIKSTWFSCGSGYEFDATMEGAVKRFSEIFLEDIDRALLMLGECKSEYQYDPSLLMQACTKADKLIDAFESAGDFSPDAVWQLGDRLLTIYKNHNEEFCWFGENLICKEEMKNVS